MAYEECCPFHATGGGILIPCGEEYIGQLSLPDGEYWFIYNRRDRRSFSMPKHVASTSKFALAIAKAKFPRQADSFVYAVLQAVR